jgi:hypothetical protein
MPLATTGLPLGLSTENDLARLGVRGRSPAYAITETSVASRARFSASRARRIASSVSGRTSRTRFGFGIRISRTGFRSTRPQLTAHRNIPEICPPSTVNAAYKAHAGEKWMAIYPYNDHEGGGAFHQVEQMTWLRSLM